MGIAEQVLIGLVTTFAGFLIALTWRMSRRHWIFWRAWRFWRPLFSGDVNIVVARFDQFNSWEASGLVGVGGMQAAAEIVSFLNDLGVQGAGRKTDIVYHDRADGELYGSNLICIGGPDANSVTRLILEKLEYGIRLGIPEQHDITITDVKNGRSYVPEVEHVARGETRVTLDHGVVIKEQNPFNRERCILILAGSFGFGTWAAAKLLRSRQFLANPLVRKGVNVECLFKSEIIDEIPQEPEIITIREVSARNSKQPLADQFYGPA
jgi:hypothetical protein